MVYGSLVNATGTVHNLVQFVNTEIMLHPEYCCTRTSLNRTWESNAKQSGLIQPVHLLV